MRLNIPFCFRNRFLADILSYPKARKYKVTDNQQCDDTDKHPKHVFPRMRIVLSYLFKFLLRHYATTRHVSTTRSPSMIQPILCCFTVAYILRLFPSNSSTFSIKTDMGRVCITSAISYRIFLSSVIVISSFSLAYTRDNAGINQNA